MAKFTVSVPVPEGLDPEKAIAILAEAARNETAKAARDSRWQAALESDDGLRAWMEAEGHPPFAPIVRASTYDEYRGGGCYSDGRQLGGLPSGDPRRPVLMRGSMHALIVRYGNSRSYSANGWCARIVERYFRRIKLTCFECEEFRKLLHSVLLNLQKRYYISDHFRFHGSVTFFGDDCLVYFKGRSVWITRERRARWLAARAAREHAMRIEIPHRISSVVAQRSLRKLGVFATQREAAQVLLQILDQRKKEHVHA